MFLLYPVLAGDRRWQHGMGLSGVSRKMRGEGSGGDGGEENEGEERKRRRRRSNRG